MATAGPGAEVWISRRVEAAKAYEAAFREHGLDPLGDVDAFAAAVKAQPTAVREAILTGLERWELFASAAKSSEVNALRAAQDAIDTLAWRRQLRLIRADANEPALLLAAMEVVNGPLTFDQAEILANTLASSKSLLKSIGIVRSLREKHPTSYWVNATLASALYHSKSANRQTDLADATEALEAAAAARPESPLPHLRLAVIHGERKDTVRAKAASERALEVQYPEATRHLKAAWRRHEAKEFAQAATTAEQAVAVAPDWPPAQAALGITLLRSGNKEAAEEAFMKAVEKSPSEAAAIALLRETFTRDAGPQPPRDRLKEQFHFDRLEADLLRRVVKVRPNPSFATLNALWLHLRGVDQIDENLAVAEEMLRVANSDAQRKFAIHCYVSRSAQSGRRLKLEDPIVQQLKKYDPLNFDHIGRIAKYSGQLDVAIDACLSAYAASKEEWWEKPRVLALACRWAIGEGAAEAVEKKLRKLQADDPLDQCPTYMLAILDAQAEREKESREALARALARTEAPHMVASPMRAADFLLVGRTENAARTALLYEFHRAFDPNRNPHDRWGLPALAFAHLRAGDLASAEAAAQSAFQVSFDHLLASPKGPLGFWQISFHTEAASALARVRLRQGRYREAADILGDAYKIDPFLVNFDYYPHKQLDPGADYAVALLLAGDVAEAGKVARQIVGFRPEQSVARQALGQVLLAEGKPKEAAAEFQAAAKLDPFDGHADFHLGRALLALGDLDDAVQAFERSVQAYRRRRIRDLAPIPEEAARAVLTALRQKPLDALPADMRKTVQAKALGWVKDDLADWKAKAEGATPFEYMAAASVLSGLTATKEHQDAGLVESLPADLRREWDSLWSDAQAIRQKTEAKRANLPQDPVEWLWPASRERELAEWVIQQGGMVTVMSPKVQGRAHRFDWLPQDTFRIEGISLSGLPVDDAVIDKLANLLMLTEVHLDGTGVTDAGVRKLATIAPLLSRLNVERTKVSDAGLAAVAHLTEICARKTAVSAGAVAALTRDPLGPRVLHESTLPSTPKKGAGYALHFDGLNAHAELPVPYESGRPLTIEATIAVEPGMANRFARVVSCENPEGTTGIIPFVHLGREIVSAIIPKGNGYHWTTRPKSMLSYLERVPIAMTFDGKTLRTFANGKLVGEGTPPGVVGGVKLGHMALAKHAAHAADHFRGVVDEVRISSTCRYVKDYTPTERLEADAATEGLYHLDEGTGEILRDSSGKGRDGRIVGAKWVREDER